jgi:hypothetical protein
MEKMFYLKIYTMLLLLMLSLNLHAQQSYKHFAPDNQGNKNTLTSPPAKALAQASCTFTINPSPGGGTKRASNCYTQDGSFKLQLTPSSQFTYAWYDANGNYARNKAGHLITGDYLKDVYPGNYTVVATRSDGCVGTATIEVENQDPVPDISATFTPITSCTGTGSQSSITVTLSGGLSTKTYYLNLLQGSITGPVERHFSITGNNSFVLNNIDPDSYVIKFTTQNNVGSLEACEENPYFLTIDPFAPNYSITASQSNNNNCLTANGEMTVNITTIPSPAAGYTYQWYEGANTGTGGMAGQTTNTLSGRTAGTYTVNIINNNTGCEAEEEFTIIDDLPLPQVTPSITSHYSDCNAPNGAATAAANTPSGTEPASGYTFNWFEGNDTSGTAVDPNDLDNLEPGLYTVYAINNDTQCASQSETIEIENLTSSPVVTLVHNQPQTSCNTNKNGALTISPTSTDYTYEWFNQSGTSIASTSALTGQDQGTYTIRVTHTASNCRTEREFIIDEVLVRPEPNAGATPFTSCASHNGTVSTSPSMPSPGLTPSGYTISWYEGEDTSGTLLDNNNLSQLLPGDYTVVVTNNDTGCESNPETVSIDDNADYPVVSLANEQPQTSCNTTKNGGLTINPSSGNYTYQWFTGSFNDETEQIINDATSNSISGMDTGTYSIVVAHGTSGCENRQEFQITENLVRPQVSIQINSHYTQCQPANGSLTATALMPAPGITPSSGYSFTWHEGTSTAGPNITPSSNPETIQEKEPGSYTVVVTNNNTGCTSNPVTEQIQHQANLPAISLLNEKPQTSCNADKNGSLSISPATGNYQWEWFTGSTTANAIPDENTSIIENLDTGNYTIRITDNTNGCHAIQTFNISENLVKPSVSATVNSNYTNCSPPNGTITASAITESPGTEPSGYTFIWYSGDDVNGPEITPATNPHILANQINGSFTVVAINNDTDCESDPLTRTILERRARPIIAITEVARQTSCQGSNGILQASASTNSSLGTEPTNGYSYEWFSGSGTGGAAVPVENITNGGTRATGLSQGNYTVRVTNNDTQCPNTRTFFLNEEITNPVVEATVNPITRCNTLDGSITPSIVSARTPSAPENDLGHTFIWYKGTSTSTLPIASTDESNPNLDENSYGEELPTGWYTVVAEDNYTGCTSRPVSIRILPPPPAFTIESILNRPSTACTDTDDGIISAKVNTPNGGHGYAFEWYNGVPVYTNPPSDFTTDPPYQFEDNTPLNTDPGNIYPGLDMGSLINTEVFNPSTNQTLYGYEAGRYTVVVTDLQPGGCKQLLTINLPFINAPEVITVDAEMQNNTVCSNPSNGKLAFQINPATMPTNPNTGNPAEQTDFVFYVYEGTNTSGELIFGPTNGINPYHTIQSLNGGAYTIIARETYTPDQCLSVPLTVIIEDTPLTPIIHDDISANQFCTTTAGNGSIEIQASAYDGDDDSGGYRIQWWHPGFDPDTNAPNATSADGVNMHILDNLLNGYYTVRVTNLVSNCYTQENIRVPFTPLIPQINDATINPVSSCSIDGSITIDDTHIAPGTGSVNDYVFTWYAGDAEPANIISGETGHALSNIEDGIYHVSITQNDLTGPGQGCQSAPFQVEVEDERERPELDFNPTANLSCDPNLPDGRLSVTIHPLPSGGTPDYTVQWFAGGLPVNPSSPIDVANGGNTTEIFDVLEGTYSVRITNDDSGCTYYGRGTIGKQEKLPVVAAIADHHQTHCTQPDGSATAQVVIDPMGTETFTWFNGQNTTTSIPGYNETIDDRTAGYYTVTATNVLHCTSLPYTVEILDRSIRPAARFTSTDNFACNPALANGSLSVEGLIDGTLRPESDFTFQWMHEDLTLVPDTPHNGNTHTISQMTEGTYLVDIFFLENGCPARGTASINKHEKLPVVTAIVDNHYDNCVAPNGQATASLNETTTDDTFDWWAGNNQYGSNLNIHTATLSSREDGWFTVLATNDVECVSRPYAVQILDHTIKPQYAFTASLADNACDPIHANGSLTIEPSISINPNATLGDFNIQWFSVDTNGNEQALGTGNTNTISNRQAGTYIAEITYTGNGCSARATRDVSAYRIHPVVSVENFVHNTNCHQIDPNFSPNGWALAALANNADPALHKLEWYVGTDTTGAEVFNGLHYQNLQADVYAVKAINNLGCHSPIDVIEIRDDLALPVINFVSSLTRPNTNCTGAGNGELTAFAMTRGVASGYNWTSPAGGVANANQYLTTGLSHTTSVNFEVSDTQNGCQGAATRGVDQVIPTIRVTQVREKPQEICIPDGQLEVQEISLDNTPGSLTDFSISWTTGNGNPVTNLNALVADVNYFVTVTKNTDHGYGCTSFPQGYILQDSTEDPVVNFDTDRTTLCDSQGNSHPTNGNGRIEVFAVVNNQRISESNTNYTYSWFRVPSPTTDIQNDSFYTNTGKRVENQPVGTFAFRVENISTGCVTYATEGIQANTEAALFDSFHADNTFCEAAGEHNGSLWITLLTDQNDVSISWFDGDDNFTGTPRSTESIITGLPVGMYSLLLYNQSTQCRTERSYGINDDLDEFPGPQVLALSAQRHCFNPDGAGRVASMLIEGVDRIDEFDFIWTRPSLSDFSFEGIENLTLTEGEYLIHGVHQTTKCPTESSALFIENNQTKAEFNLRKANATCDKNIGELSLRVRPEGPKIIDIEWFDTNGKREEDTGKETIRELAPGIYRIRVTTEDGCEFEREETIIEDFLPFQGVSNNGDSFNESFHISCIDRFPNNNVKIYNRAGTLVFEADNYDNASVTFKGIGNRGLYPGGRNLPEGTYFYVIDKKDGSKPMAGFLELTR